MNWIGSRGGRMARIANRLSRLLGSGAAAPSWPMPEPLPSAQGPIAIRPGRASDVPALLPMIAKTTALHQGWDSAKFGFVDDIVPKYGAWLKAQVPDPRFVFLVAAIADRPVAYLIAAVESAAPIYRPAEYGFIRDLWVDEDHRRAGIGQALLRAAIARFAALGITQVRLETAAANEAARRFFASCGFRPSATEMLIE